MSPYEAVTTKEAATTLPAVQQRLPIITLAVLVITGIGTALQLMFPGVFPALRRDPAALKAGEWWRLVTPLLVNDGNPLLHYL